jgi:hypothetical protein
MAFVRMTPPAGVTYFNVNGQTRQIESDGQIEVPARYVLALLAQGYVVAPDDMLAANGVDFPTQGTMPGMSIFHLGLNKPLYRNAANGGWVDSTGTAVVP